MAKGQIVNARGTCNECNWTATGRNALGLAGIHFRKSGHYIHVEVDNLVTFGAAPSVRGAIIEKIEAEEQAQMESLEAYAKATEL